MAKRNCTPGLYEPKRKIDWPIHGKSGRLLELKYNHRHGGDNMKLILIIFLLAVAGCSNNYAQFYTPVVTDQELQKLQLLKYTEEPTLYVTSNIQHDLKKFFEKGYVALLSHSFK